MESQETRKWHWCYKVLNVCKSVTTQIQPGPSLFCPERWDVCTLLDGRVKKLYFYWVTFPQFRMTQHPCHRDGRVLLQSHPSLRLPLQEAPLQLSLQSSLLWGGTKWKGGKRINLVSVETLLLSLSQLPDVEVAGRGRRAAGFGLEQVLSCHWLIFVGSSERPNLLTHSLGIQHSSWGG